MKGKLQVRYWVDVTNYFANCCLQRTPLSKCKTCDINLVFNQFLFLVQSWMELQLVLGDSKIVTLKGTVKQTKELPVVLDKCRESIIIRVS